MAAEPVGSPEPALIAGRYEILGLLGIGGMGRVYRARDRELGEEVALKVLQVQALDGVEVLERFRREARLARQVTHRNVVRLFDLGDDDGRKFLTMELVEGESLAALLRRERTLPVARALDLAADICAGLEAAHLAGVVHRDLKPANVLIARDGRVLLTDFGVATSRSEADRSALTGGLLLGTPDYMAPEQVEGLTDVDARVDLFAMGAMLYEMLAGSPPWTGPTAMAVAIARLRVPAPDLRALRSDLPAGLGDAIHRCLERDPARRFATARLLADALAAVRRPTLEAEGPTRGRPTTPPVEFGVSTPGIKTLAVLPFRNAGPPDDQYVADGLTEDLADLLSMTPGLRVRAAGLVGRVAAARPDMLEAGRELGVQVIVAGSVRRISEGVRIAVRAVGVADGFQLWARHFDRGRSDLLVASDEIARAVAGALATEVGAPERGAAPDPEAVDLYLRGRQQARLRFSPAAAGEAVALLERAVTRLPDEPTLRSAYTMALSRLSWFSLDDEPLRARAAALAEETVARAPHLAEPWLARGTVRLHAGDVPAAVRDLLVALRRNPGLGDAYEQLGVVLCEAGLVEEGRRLLHTALQLDPTNEAPWAWLANVHLFVGDLEAGERCLDHMTGDAFAPMRAIALARACSHRRDAERARRVLASLPPGDNDLLRGAREVLARVSGASPRIHAEVAERMARPSMSLRRRSFAHQMLAEVAAFENEPEVVLRQVEAATEAGLIDLVWMDHALPLAAVRSAPRFGALRDRVAAAAARVVEAYRSKTP